MAPALRFLVADDERHITRLLQVNLERQGYSVTSVHDGRQAIAAFESGEFDKVVLDHMMPYVDGYEVLAWIRQHEKTHTWVALMSAQADQMRDDDTLPYRADLYVNKPFNPGEFLR